MSDTSQYNLQALQHAYRASLPDKHTEITTCWLIAEQAHWRIDTVEQLQSTIHQLINSSKLYGFTDISAAAHEIEHKLSLSLEQDNLLDIERGLQLLCSLLVIHTNKETVGITPPLSSPLLTEHWLNAHTNKYIVVLGDTDSHDFVQFLHDKGYHVTLFTDYEQFKQQIPHISLSVLIFHLSFTNYSNTTLTELEHYCNHTLQHIPRFAVLHQNDFTHRLLAARLGVRHCFIIPINFKQLIEALTQIFTKTPPYHVLLIIDDKGIAQLYQTALQQANIKTYLIHDKEIEQLFSIMREFPAELLLIDKELKYYNSRHIINILHQEKSFFHLPILFLSNDNNKPFYPMRLGGEYTVPKTTKLENILSFIIYKIQDGRYMNKYIAYNPLTDLLNCVTFQQQFFAQLATAERLGIPIALIMLDVDKFQQISSAHGYWVSNEVLQRIAWAIKNRLRRGDLIGHWNTDQFFLALHGAESESAIHITTSLLEEINKIIFNINTNQFSITLSAGIAYYPGHVIQQKSTLLQQAEQALACAKQAGGNQYKLILSTED